LSIDPTFSGGSNLPQGRVTLKQRISSGMTFTDIAAVNDPNTQIIRVEWASIRQPCQRADLIRAHEEALPGRAHVVERVADERVNMAGVGCRELVLAGLTISV
jgi:hypothetical protein